MADQFRLSGDFQTSPGTGSSASIDPQVQSHIDERMSLVRKSTESMVLTVDTPVAVDMTNFQLGAHVVVLKSNAKVQVRVTSADGSVQAFPADVWVSICRDVPITALDVTRVAGVETTVRVFMGERSS